MEGGDAYNGRIIQIALSNFSSVLKTILWAV
jgi:hypothetical protein